jgi:DNA-directed RNA polymerase specialized sigma24 family protein
VIEDLQANTPLESIVHCLRIAVSRGDIQCRNRLLALIVQRTQTANERWVQRALQAADMRASECTMLAEDLYADLCERMLYAVLDSRRNFWEVNFLHCLYFERKHAFRSLMTREGRWYNPAVEKCERVPHASIISLDRAISLEQVETTALTIADPQADTLFRSIDHYDLLQHVFRLPTHLRAVVLLIFWEGKSEKEAAHILGITDRTIRNRLQRAFKVLRAILIAQEDVFS